MEGARNRRNKKNSAKLIEVTEGEKKNVVRARLAALEEDDGFQADKQAGSDDDFRLEESEEELALGEQRKKKRKKETAKRKSRGLQVDKAAKSLFEVLEENEVEKQPAPNYLTAAVGPPTVGSVQKWCSTCGFAAPYTCMYCSSRFCTRKCYFVHRETRCLQLAV